MKGVKIPKSGLESGSSSGDGPLAKKHAGDKKLTAEKKKLLKEKKRTLKRLWNTNELKINKL